MRVSYKNKIIFVLTIYFAIGSVIWFLNYFNNNLINHRIRVIEKKEDLLNTILEARRYEKNFFLTQHEHHLDSAISFIRQAEQKMADLIEMDETVPNGKNISLRSPDLEEYRSAMSFLVTQPIPDAKANHLVSSHERMAQQEIIRRLGRTITETFESMVLSDRERINRLVQRSRFYHFATLMGMILITTLAALFFFFNVIRPLKMLEKSIGEIASGNYKHIPSIAAAVEFESLVGSLNRMIGMLNRRSEALIQEKKLAALGTLTSGVAHELNNPLNNISTSMQILLEELEDPDLDYKRELLQDSEKEVERARDIVRALLEFSRQHAFSIKTILFRPLVDDTIKLIKCELPPSIKLVVDVPQDIRASVDTRRIQQVLLNLIFNAIQSMESGGTITVLARQSSEDTFYLSVSDTGRGIPPEMLSKIFDPFFSTKSSRRRTDSDSSSYDGYTNHQGTGLGLAICHGIVDKHNGRIEVKSKVGEGTTFTVYLPLEKSDEVF